MLNYSVAELRIKKNFDHTSTIYPASSHDETGQNYLPFTIRECA